MVTAQHQKHKIQKLNIQLLLEWRKLGFRYKQRNVVSCNNQSVKEDSQFNIIFQLEDSQTQDSHRCRVNP